MRRSCLLAALLLTSLLASLLTSRTGRAGTLEVQIHLLIMGPGEHLYTRGGHAALMVAEMEDGAPVRSAVYNYGDTDWDDPLLVPHFLRGDLVFFLTNTGSLVPTLEDYGVRQGRPVTRQRLALTADQVAEIKRRLEEGVTPGKREYTFHHVHALCSTQIMDLLDDVLGGRLRAELGAAPGPYTARHYQEVIFSASNLASIGGDLFLGRLHDRVLNRYESAASPENMRAYLQTIQVPEPSGGGATVPLAEPPVPLVERTEPLTVQRNRFTRYLWSALIVLLLGAGALAYRRAAAAPSLAAKVVAWAAVPSGLVGVILLGFILFSKVPEFRCNELILVFWPTDLWLARRVRRLPGEPATQGRWVMGYAHARLGVAALGVLGHLTGVLHQEPRILAALGGTFALVSWVLIRRLRGGAAIARATEPPALEPAGQ